MNSTLLNKIIQHELTIQIRVKSYRVLLALAWLLLCGYIWYSYQWYELIGVRFVKWHTHFAPYVLFLLLSISLIPARKTKWFLLVFSTLFILMAIEFVFYWQEVGSFAEMFRFNYIEVGI